MTTRKHALLLLLITLLITPALSFAEAGKIMFALGGSTIVKADGSSVKARRGLSIDSGDKIQTSTSGQVQIKMDDGGLVAVRPNSVFIIDEFVNTGDVEKDKTFYSLVKGGFRSVTGSVGEKNKSAYKVNTPVATIGIRGTDYSARLCAGDCGATDDGLYVGVFSGGISLSNDVGIIDVNPTEFGYVADPFTVPQNVESTPSELLFAKSSTGESGSNTNDAVESLAAIQPELIESPETNPDLTPPESTPESEPETSDTSTTQLTATRVLSATSGQQFTGINESETNPDIRNVDVASSGEITSFSSNYTDPVFGTATEVTVKASANTTLADYNSDASIGINWGRWNGGDVEKTTSSGTTPETLDDSTSVHWIALTNDDTIVLPTTGQATYDYAGGTSPTDGLGHVGEVTGATLTAHFDTQKVDYTMDAFVTDTTNTVDVAWSINKTGMQIQSDGSFGGSLANGDVEVFYDRSYTDATGSLIGSFSAITTSDGQPAGAMTAYALDATTDFDGNIELNGTVALKNSSLP